MYPHGLNNGKGESLTSEFDKLAAKCSDGLNH